MPQPDVDTGKTTARQPRADAQRSREQILAAARGRDAHELRLNDVARDAGVGVGTVYRHFPTVQALVEALALDALESLRDLAARAAADRDTTRALTELLRGTLRLQLADTGLQSVLIATTEETPEAAHLKRELFGSLSELVGRGIGDGILRPEMTVARMQHLLCGIEYAVRIGDDADAALYLDIVMAGLGPAPTV